MSTLLLVSTLVFSGNSCQKHHPDPADSSYDTSPGYCQEGSRNESSNGPTDNHCQDFVKSAVSERIHYLQSRTGQVLRALYDEAVYNVPKKSRTGNSPGNARPRAPKAPGMPPIYFFFCTCCLNLPLKGHHAVLLALARA